jgi:MFS-type transporter involved in bile tolerance (Atg22 family)
MVAEKNLNLKNMKNLKFTSLAVIVILFGVTLVEAVQKQNWLEVVLFLALVAMALWADLQKK